MGAAAAARASLILRVAIAEKGSARIVLASSPSQNEFLARLTCAPEIDWSRVTIFHMDEFVGMPSFHHASFRKVNGPYSTGAEPLDICVTVRTECSDTSNTYAAAA